ncbi:MAG: hypothetical protein HYX47_05060 [Burkholderiales bacterium]|nr:hypothetical protein [Burkholderiales bacterium]
MRRFRIQSRTHDEPVAPAAVAGSWEMAVIGEDGDLDERSKAAGTYVRANAKTTHMVRFDIAGHKNELRLNGTALRLAALKGRFAGVKSLLVEASSLSFPEILYVTLAAIYARIPALRFVYVEPREYRRDIQGRLCDQRNFELSDNRRFQAIPGFQTNLSETEVGQAVFFLGFEGSRLGQALEQQEVLRGWGKHAVFGVPAFSPGWEIDAMANNVQYLGKGDQVKYASAASADAAYRLLSTLLEQDKEERPILVAPLGTKPHAIGAALFLIENESMDRALLLYDHPTRSSGRSSEVRRWHFFDVSDAGG